MDDTKKINTVDMVARFTRFEVINPEFTRARVNVFYTGRNRNYSDITDEALQKFIDRKGYANIPVVAHLMKKDDGTYVVGGHDQKIVLSNEGIDFVDETVPFGVIPEDCNPGMETITERSGEKRDYFSVDIILWTHRYPIMEAAYSDEIYFNQSMELTFLDVDFDGDYIVVNDFSMSALCLLNKSMNSEENVEPCFESSQVRKFSIDEKQFKENFDLLLDTIKQYESDNDNPIQDKPIDDPTTMKGVQDMELSKFAEVLSTVKIEGKDDCKYTLLNASETQVYVLDMEDYKPYGFDYAIITEDDNESIVIDYESKVEMSLSATEKINDENFTEFDMSAEIENKVSAGIDERVEECTAQLNAGCDELKEEYEKLVAEYEAATERIKGYEEAEKAAKKEAHAKEVEDIFNKYAEKLSKYSEFLVYRAKVDPDEVTTEELEQKLTLMVGKFMMNAPTKNFTYQPEVNGVADTSESSDNGRYGDLLKNYM